MLHYQKTFFNDVSGSIQIQKIKNLFIEHFVSTDCFDNYECYTHKTYIIMQLV